MPLLRAVAAEYGWPDYQPVEKAVAKVEPAVLASYAGEYLEEHVGKIIVTSKEGKLYLQAEPLGPEPTELLPESATEFFLRTQLITFRFEGKPRKPAETLIIMAGQPYRANRQK